MVGSHRGLGAHVRTYAEEPLSNRRLSMTVRASTLSSVAIAHLLQKPEATNFELDYVSDVSRARAFPR